ncbi:hypothetical protein BAE36_25050 [Rhizobium leguminosarum bv. trifolii]|uniref:Uncharacterized protein n=1 Tax=Rhizobium leguminosarum bv. trifolii TaxID=386 RepID=A0A1B8R6T9_RHILT|nr:MULTISPECIES: hypothetical protein [Rhizobium]AOO92655.1 hypothetical protein [Rhizobium leguminosarum bv. trifolii]OBY04480.1 hypothetical protein BAE36_25050 [Rhizobium leguminosarum bv. trifolii]WSG87368.1 hypothetical protein U8P73_15050 [Rhizobium beringeri]
MQIEIKGKLPGDPQGRVLAIEAAAKAICQQAGTDPADAAVMMLLTAAAHLFTVYSGKPSSENIMGLARSLGCATVAADEFFRLKAATSMEGSGE